MSNLFFTKGCLVTWQPSETSFILKYGVGPFKVVNDVYDTFGTIRLENIPRRFASFRFKVLRVPIKENVPDEMLV